MSSLYPCNQCWRSIRPPPPNNMKCGCDSMFFLCTFSVGNKRQQWQEHIVPAMARAYCAEKVDEKKLGVLIQSLWNSLYVRLCTCWVLFLCTCTYSSILLCTCKIILMHPC
uniref:Predicted protein n=1 Tax=Hordeum vulgare subsp. vulgare TaxID=112509 RepID=F2E7A7_HORVV|nr:predicted protein [Hordeum vulgare subsp. vulgare]